MSHQPHDQNRKDLDDLATRRGAYNRPRARKLQPNDRVQRSAATLLDLGTPVTAAVHHLREQLDAIGYPDTTGDSACHAHNALALKEDLRDAITDIEKRINALARLVVAITNEPLPGLDGVALCSDNQHGREGVAEWGDPACTSIPAKSGLCTRDYQRERQWRVAADLADRSEPAA